MLRTFQGCLLRRTELRLPKGCEQVNEKVALNLHFSASLLLHQRQQQCFACDNLSFVFNYVITLSSNEDVNNFENEL